MAEKIGDIHTGTAPMTESPAADSVTEQALFAQYRWRELALVLHGQDRMSALGNIVTAFLMIMYVNGHVNSIWMHLFVFASALCTAVMLVQNWLFYRVADVQTAYQYQLWVYWHRAFGFLGSVIFSASVYLLSISTAVQSVWVATIAGVLYSSAVTIGVGLDWFSFLSAMPLIMAVLIWIQATQGSMYLAIGFFFFLLFTIVMVKSTESGYQRSVAIAFENRILAKRLEIENARAIAGQKAAEEANLAKSKFFAAANHDLRQPLHALALGIQQLKIERQASGKETALDIVHSASSSLINLFGQLMEVAKLDSASDKVVPAHFPVHPLLNRIKSEFTAIAREKQIRFVINSARQVALSDELSVERMLRNLIGNALKFTDQGTVLLACRSSGHFLRLQVWDTGIGIDPANLQRIFDEFHQINPQEQYRGQAKGSGLGLSIVRRLASTIGTAVVVRSTPGRGSVFEFKLPMGSANLVIPADAVVPAVWHAKSLLSRSISLSIYVLEDDELGGAALKALLVAWGASVTLFQDTHAALVDLANAPKWPDIVIADYQIHDSTSVPILEYLLQTPGRTKLIVISGVQSAELQAYLFRGNVSFIPKPVDPTVLYELLQHIATAT